MTRPGAYALLFSLSQDEQIEVGRLGTVHFPRGQYGYVGSAMGSGGLDARIARHLRAEKKRHWHIDYLLKRADVAGALEFESPTRIECTLSDALTRGGASTTPAPSFGSSDCRCRSHLHYFGDESAAEFAAHFAGSSVPGLGSGVWRPAQPVAG
jgi:Uri superfamily endonuclease